MSLPEDTILENRYRIDRPLSQGGMGAIYRGFDIKLKIPVAIKENFFQTPQSIRQFEQEALLLARLHHPNLPRVIDHFSFEGQQYLVMDFVEGLDLWEMVKQREQPLDEQEALNYIAQVCDAVNYLHQHKPPIIHRDIKPQNIKITPEGQAVLVDFGIAKIAESGAHTSTGARGVTPGFSPPEQYSGMGTNQTSDVYALGATLYALLTGQKPPDSVSLMVGGAKFQPPDVINPKLSWQVARAIEHAMQVQQANRPQSVIAWWQELKTALLGDSEATGPAGYGSTLVSLAMRTALSSPPVGATPARPKPPVWLWIGGALMILLLMGGGGVFLLLSRWNNTREQALTTPTPAGAAVWTPTTTPPAAATWTPTTTPLAAATWTPTATPPAAVTWTPTPSPGSLISASTASSSPDYQTAVNAVVQKYSDEIKIENTTSLDSSSLSEVLIDPILEKQKRSACWLSNEGLHYEYSNRSFTIESTTFEDDYHATVLAQVSENRILLKQNGETHRDDGYDIYRVIYQLERQNNNNWYIYCFQALKEGDPIACEVNLEGENPCK